MNILYIHQYFVTPTEPGGTRSYWLAKELVNQGHKVTMLTSSTKFRDSIVEKHIDGIRVLYLREDYDQQMSVSRRLRAFLKFMYKSSHVAIKQKDIDLVFATSTPLTIGIPALLMKWYRKIPFVFEVRDLWPEVPIQMGALKNPILRGIAKLLEKTIYTNAEHVIGLSPGMVDGVAKYIDRDKISMIPNMSKMDEFYPRERNMDLIDSLGLSKTSFKLIHFGSLGLANGVDTIIESAKILREDSTIEFLFVGGGAIESDLRETCEKFDLKNVKFLGKFPMKDTSELVNISDVSIVSFKDIPILYTNSPNKLFDSLSAGKPIIVNSAGWTKGLVDEFGCGYYVNPNTPQDLVSKIIEMKNNPALIKSMGERSRWIAENMFDKSILSKKFVSVLESICIKS